MTVHLSPRLSAIADLIAPGARVIDVGTDHAMLPVYLAQTGKAAHVWASDIRPGPLSAARSLVARTGTGDTVELRLTDGLSGFSRADGDTVVIAGMGGETMVSILTAAPWVRDGIRLILAPQTKQKTLRRFLVGQGFFVESEHLVQDAGRIYPFFVAGAGQAPEYTPAEFHAGLFAQISAQPLFGEYLDILIKKAAAAAPYDEEAAMLLTEYKTMKERL